MCHLNGIGTGGNMNRTQEVELTNMCFIYDENRILVEEKKGTKYTNGLVFPGGHIEQGESFRDSVIREIKEETGLDIQNLKACGFMYWFNNKTEDKYFTYFYKTTEYSGKLLDATDEGSVFWAEIADLDHMKLAPNFREYLPMFLEDKYCEAYCSWNRDMHPDESCENPWGILYK